MKNLKLSLLGWLCLVSSSGYSQTKPAAKHIEKMIAGCIEKAMATSVYIIEWDTLAHKVQDGVDEANGFTGVVVSAEGHILTASHAAMPNQVYQISFPDGNKHIAVGVGRIGIQDKNTDYDMAMVKILKPGSWPFAEMAASTELQLNQPVVSISYPGAFFKRTPNVRFGRISDIDLTDGFIESSAKMEPGDSGGPLFDVLGRVVGVHSWIKEAEDQNYDVPADHFLKYWTALNQAKDYTVFPAADEVPAVAFPISMETVPSLEEVAGVSSLYKESAVVLNSTRGMQSLSIRGTLVDFGGTVYVVSKSSMVANHAVLKLNKHTVPVQVLKRDRANDLVLLKVTAKLRGGITLKSTTENPALQQKDIGTILVSVLSKDSTKVGVLSATYIDMPLNASKGYFGASAVDQEGKITLSGIGKGTEAASLFKVGDQVIKINGVEVRTAAEYNHEFEKYIASDSISADIIRDGRPMQLILTLEAQPTVRHVSFDYAGGRSARSDGFKNVLVQDAAVRTDECGGPVFDSAGNFYGINIARRSRTATIVTPVATLVKFIKDSI
ncbi:probable serine protease DO-like protein [Pedobacter sp. BAL39]|uniref:trypsin-like peptidase domain-containing protein n=1 Tax=Pedobacter sp. BAL39 TaxID=391596 RepID=UPI0001559AEB|nr:trypsin-like peptidase domain-containing protein [Pedobacter sp. BAL39]EDM36505.1 probable serine protease DO-like protein [Pedobacter sp. BAL39]